MMSFELGYEIVTLDLATHEFVLRLEVASDLECGLSLTMPAWIPGSYMIRDFARNVTAISATDSKGKVPLEKVDKQTWRCVAARGRLTVEYRVYAFDLSVRSAYLDDTRAYFNGTSLFLRPVGFEDNPCRLRIHRPQHPATAGWRVWTSMAQRAVDESFFGSYVASDYWALVDYPVEIGRLSALKFDVDGIAHTVAISEAGRFDGGRMERDLASICSEHVAMFGELPVDRYLFLVLAVADGYGGLEHLDSTSLVCRRSDLPSPTQHKLNDGYRRFLGLCSHEYFHLWNVKRIRPERLAEADLRAETHTSLLWAFEGITSYYDDLALVRSGTASTEDYLDLLAKSVTRLLRNPGRRRQSVAESSFDAWTRFYKQDENAANAIVSYYTKGAMVALGLDVAMRTHSADRLSLDDLMRRLWFEYGKTGRGIPEGGIESVVAEVLGEPLDDFFAGYVYGVAELPLSSWFEALGIGYRKRPGSSIADEGGYRSKAPDAEPSADIGLRCDKDAGVPVVRQVLAASPAQLSGISPGDRIVAIDGERATAENWPDLLTRAIAETVEIHLFRRDRLVTRQVNIELRIADTCDLWLLPESELPGNIRARRASWLTSCRCR